MDLSEPILIGIGSTEAQGLPLAVLEYSLRMHCSKPIEVVPLYNAGIEIPVPRDAQNAPRTPFSFQRFLLPELGEFRRRGIYLDSDMIAMADVSELDALPLDDVDFVIAEPTPGFEPSHSLMLTAPSCRWQIGEIVDRLDRGELSYERLMFEFDTLGSFDTRLPYSWNSLERYEEGRTRVLHFTAMSSQPWLSRKNPLASIWIGLLIEAVEAAAISLDYVEECARRRWIRPSLVWQVRRGEKDVAQIPRHVAWRDRSFLAECRRRSWLIV